MKKNRIITVVLASFLAISTITTTVNAAEINKTQTVLQDVNGETSFVQNNASKVIGTVANCTQLNLRASANANAKILAVLKKGDKVDVIKKLSNGWVNVKYNGVTGYVNGKYLTLKTVTTTSVTVTSLNKTGTVSNCESLTVRSTYSTNGKVLGYLKKGQKVTITGKSSNEWYRIKYNNGTGYVSGKYITISGTGTGTGTGTETNVSARRKAIIARAKEMVQVTWTSPISFLGWRAKSENNITKGKKYTGIPYSQTPYQSTSGANFKSKLSIMPSKFRATIDKETITMPKYGNDCSGFVSFALGVSRHTTSDMSKCTQKISYNSLKPGDILNKAGTHVVLFAGWADAAKTKMYIYEQTPPRAVYRIALKSYYTSRGYVARRLNGLN